MSALQWLQGISTIVSITWSQSSTTLMLLVSDARQTGLSNVFMHASRVLLLRLSDSGQHQVLTEGTVPGDGLAAQGAPHVQLHSRAVTDFAAHACYQSRLSAPLDTAALRTSIADGACRLHSLLCSHSPVSARRGG